MEKGRRTWREASSEGFHSQSTVSLFVLRDRGWKSEEVVGGTGVVRAFLWLMEGEQWRFARTGAHGLRVK